MKEKERKIIEEEEKIRNEGKKWKEREDGRKKGYKEK